MADLTFAKTNEIKSLAYVVRQLIEQRLLDCHYCLPGRIEKYDRATRKADVKPLLKKKDNTAARALPIITNVPVTMPTANNNTAFIDFPIKRGDTGTIIFSERSLDLWLVQGGDVDPKDPRKNDLSDGIFIPGLNPFNISMSIPTDDSIRIMNGTSIVDIMPTGKFKIKNDSNELIALLSDALAEVIALIDTLKIVKTITLAGLQPFEPASQALLATEKTNFTTLKSKLDTLKG
jgi:hypothetical protein